MSDLLNKNLGSVNYDNLIIKSGHVGHVQLAAGQGKLSKGSVIATDGTLLTTGKEASYILCDDTVTDDTDTVTAAVYKTGNYIRNSLIVADNYTFTDSDAEKLRKVGIIVEAAR